MKASDYIASRLAENGTTAVFEMSGGMITHLLDSLHKQGRVRIVSMHHEQGAAFAADAYGRVTGRPGVAMATSGPGATNLITAIGSCYFDSSPAVFITGQVNANEMRGERAIRQLGFQETDIVSIVRPITKAAYMVIDPTGLPAALDRAFEIASSDRPGPVLIDIPMNVQRSPVEPVPLASPHRRKPGLAPAVAAALATIRQAERPLIVVGGGLRASGARAEFREFVRREGIPVAASLMAVDALPYENPLRLGMLGSYGNRWVNLAVGRADAVLVLGSRLDVRQTGADVVAWRGARAIVHVDCDPAEMNNRVQGCEAIEADLKDFLAVALAQDGARPERAAWLEELAALRARWPDTDEIPNLHGINPNALMHALSQVSREAGGYIVDVGQHQMWAAQSLELVGNQQFHTSGGMGSMGFALPAAIGACVARPDRPWVLIAGDGGFQANIQELQTVVRNSLPLKLVVLNNQAHGMVRQFQESYFGSRFQSTVWGYSAPDFTAVARAYGIRSCTVDSEDGIEGALRWLWEDPAAPSLLQVTIDQRTNVYPKIAFGLPMTEMEPHAKPIAMEGT